MFISFYIKKKRLDIKNKEPRKSINAENQYRRLIVLTEIVLVIMRKLLNFFWEVKYI